jgi:hypothetical protein
MKNYHHQHNRHDAVGEATGERTGWWPHIAKSLFLCKCMTFSAKKKLFSLKSRKKFVTLQAWRQRKILF